MSTLGLEFIVRDAVDRESIEWMAQSLFIKALRAASVSPSDTILDFGSHIGSFALPAAQEKGCRVVGFEPDRESLDLARANALLNRLSDRVTFHRHAIGGEDGEAPFYESTQNWGHTLIAAGGPWNRLTGKATTVRVLSLDQALDYAGDRCPFVKVNIEGAEFAMFANASADALRRVGIFASEIHCDIGNGDIEPGLVKLRQVGFQVDLFPESAERSILVARR